MIPRYSLPEIADLFTDEARFAAWLEVEVLAVEAWAELGVVPAEHARAGPRARRLRRRRPCTNARRSPTTTSPRSSTSCRSASARRPARWVHYGLTSSDVVDTALALQMTRALDAIIPAAAAARRRDRRTCARVPRHADGRPHARHPRGADDVRREARAVGDAGAPRSRAAAARARRRSRSASCRARSVRTPTSIRASSSTCASSSGLRPVPATQVLARDRHAEVMYACASLGATIESFALEIRHLQRTEVREVEEPFREGEQKGSSAMPHKRNPVKSEQLCGLARVLRGNLQAALEDVALWHERDISHSSVERVIVPDSLMLAYYMTVRFTTIATDMRVLSGPHAAQHRRVVRARVQPAGAARAGRSRARRATTPTGSCSATRCGRGRRNAAFREILERGSRRDGDARRGSARRLLRPEARALRHRAASSTRSTRWGTC